MISFAIIVFREVLEIALVLGILIAATRELPQRNKWVAIGMGAGILGSLAVAFFAEMISNALEGMGQEVFNAVVLLSAAILIGWTVIWMSRHARLLTQEIKNVSRAVREGQKPFYCLAIVIALTVLRDGSETVMFTYGSLASGERVSSLVAGSLLGLLVGTTIGMAIYYGLVKTVTKRIFLVTSWMLIFLAAGMVSQGIGFLSAAGFVPELVYPLWDTSRIIAESSWIGKVLNTLIGYTERPSGIQFLSYLVTLVGVGIILKFYGGQPARPNNLEAGKVMVG